MKERRINKNVALPESVVAGVEAVRKEFGFKTDVETYTYVLAFGLQNIMTMLEQGDEYDELEDGTRIVC